MSEKQKYSGPVSVNELVHLFQDEIDQTKESVSKDLEEKVGELKEELTTNLQDEKQKAVEELESKKSELEQSLTEKKSELESSLDSKKDEIESGLQSKKEELEGELDSSIQNKVDEKLGTDLESKIEESVQSKVDAAKGAIEEELDSKIDEKLAGKGGTGGEGSGEVDLENNERFGKLLEDLHKVEDLHVELTGDISGEADISDAKENEDTMTITAILSNTGVASGVYGPTSEGDETEDEEEEVEVGEDNIITVPQITVDEKGRVVEAKNKVVKLPENEYLAADDVRRLWEEVNSEDDSEE